MRQGLRLRSRWTIGVRLSDLEPMTTLVALTLASWANADGLGARPSLLSVANGCRLCRSSVATHIKKLDAAGWIRRSSGRGVPNRYTLLIPTEMEAKIEATLGEWGSAADGLPDGEVVHLTAPGSASGAQSSAASIDTSLTEPDIEPTWMVEGLTWKEYAKQLQERSEEEKAEKASEAREEEAI